MNRFGSDKPDMRFGLELSDFTDALRNCQAKVFAGAIQKGGVVKGIRIPKGGEMSRKDLDDMTPFVATFGAKGIAWTKITAEGWQSPIAKFLSDGGAERDRKNRRSASRRCGFIFRRHREDRPRCPGQLATYTWAKSSGLIPEK